jgi:hypothetical protein
LPSVCSAARGPRCHPLPPPSTMALRLRHCVAQLLLPQLTHAQRKVTIITHTMRERERERVYLLCRDWPCGGCDMVWCGHGVCVCVCVCVCVMW